MSRTRSSSVWNAPGNQGLTRLPDYIQSGPGGSATLQDLELAWNKVGSLTQRKDVNRTLTEDFYYDNLHRLDYSRLNGTQNLDLSYDAMGNILTKSDVSGSTWTYHATKKLAVITAGTDSYGYDANGNQSTRNGATVTWTSYNYPSHVPNGTQYHDYYYDADRQRWKQVYYNGSTSETTVFVGGILEKHTAGGITKYRHTISAGGQPVALVTRATSGAITTQYFLLDHLGSVAEITNSLGTLDVAENFAAFGERRDASDWSGPPTAADKTAIAGITQRGYTFHTNSEESSLIHMNGRIADSLTGRFLSADPYVPNPGLTQSFNRYSYVRNNPLSYTDPSGFFDAGATVSIVGTLWSFGKKLFGRKKRPPPPGCPATASAGGCYGKAVATKLYEMARDIYGLPPLQSPGIWGVGEDRFGTGTCSWSPNCMSFGDELSDVPIDRERSVAVAILIKSVIEISASSEFDELRVALRTNTTMQFKVRPDGSMTIQTGTTRVHLDGEQLLNGSGLAGKYLNLDVSLTESGRIRFTGTLKSPFKIFGVEMRFAYSDSVNIRGFAANNSGLFGQASRALDSGNRQERIDNQWCTAETGESCQW